MSDTPSPEDKSKLEGFDLDAPSADIEQFASTSIGGEDDPNAPIAVPPPPDTGEIKQKSLAWKGFEEEEEYEPEVQFTYNRDTSQDEMDMTPMVDVTFLLLIFFMVTASFASQRAAIPPEHQEDVPSTQAADPQDQSDFVEVIIDQNNTYRITSRDYAEVEAPSDIQMRAELRDAKEALGATKLLITAHENAWHERVVHVMDYGRTLGFTEFQSKTTTQEY